MIGKTALTLALFGALGGGPVGKATGPDLAFDSHQQSVASASLEKVLGAPGTWSTLVVDLGLVITLLLAKENLILRHTQGL